MRMITLQQRWPLWMQCWFWHTCTRIPTRFQTKRVCLFTYSLVSLWPKKVTKKNLRKNFRTKTTCQRTIKQYQKPSKLNKYKLTRNLCLQRQQTIMKNRAIKIFLSWNKWWHKLQMDQCRQMKVVVWSTEWVNELKWKTIDEKKW